MHVFVWVCVCVYACECLRVDTFLGSSGLFHCSLFRSLSACRCLGKSSIIHKYPIIREILKKTIFYPIQQSNQQQQWWKLGSKPGIWYLSAPLSHAIPLPLSLGFNCVHSLIRNAFNSVLWVFLCGPRVTYSFLCFSSRFHSIQVICIIPEVVCESVALTMLSIGCCYCTHTHTEAFHDPFQSPAQSQTIRFDSFRLEFFECARTQNVPLLWC